jgi:hypothetical protein
MLYYEVSIVKEPTSELPVMQFKRPGRLSCPVPPSEQFRRRFGITTVGSCDCLTQRLQNPQGLSAFNMRFCIDTMGPKGQTWRTQRSYPKGRLQTLRGHSPRAHNKSLKSSFAGFCTLVTAQCNAVFSTSWSGCKPNRAE